MHDTPTPTLIMQIAHGFMASKHLFAASELGLFEPLARVRSTSTASPPEPASPDARPGSVPTPWSRSAFSTRTATATPTPRKRPSSCPGRPRPTCDHYSGSGTGLSYPAWAELAGALGRGRPLQQIFDLDEELVPIMSAGIEAATSGACQALPAAAGLRSGSRLLDIGGGTGSWAIALAATDPALTATVLELADVAPIAESHVHASGFSDRIDIRVGDVRDGELPAGYDAFLLANVVHYFTPETNRSILRRIRAAAPAERSCCSPTSGPTRPTPSPFRRP